MKKIIICDQNKELIDYLKSNMKAGEQSSGVILEFVHGDVVELHEKTENSRIVTASNPQFQAGGGLDFVLSQKYSWKEAKEFSWNNDLFFVVSVDDERKSNIDIVKRALVGVLGYAYKFIPILTGIGTAIGGLPMQDLLSGLTTILTSANLRYADLTSANLRYADLTSADLTSANLRYADLTSANLRYADLRSANLRSADLTSANLRYADLRYADLRYADLTSANLRSADLRSANNIDLVKYNETTAFFGLACPEEGTFIAWKKANKCVVKLEIPASAKRSSATSRKCRASKAKVLAIYDQKGNELQEINSDYDTGFVYKVGHTVKPTIEFEENRWIECGSGIHFFITRKEAENYQQK